MRKGEIRTQGNYSEGEGATMTRPWRLDHSTVLDNDGNPVAIIADPAGDGDGERIEWPWVYDEAPPASYAQAEDSARLLASAPDLLEALQDLMAAEGGEGGEPGRLVPGSWRLRRRWTDEQHAAWLQGLAAIAKATGPVPEPKHSDLLTIDLSHDEGTRDLTGPFGEEE